MFSQTAQKCGRLFCVNGSIQTFASQNHEHEVPLFKFVRHSFVRHKYLFRKRGAELSSDSPTLFGRDTAKSRAWN